MPNMDTVAVGIMCKPPRPGLTKTRLAAVVGNSAAARLSEAFLRDVAAAVVAARAQGVQGWGLYMPADAEAEVRALLPASFRFAPQVGTDFSSVVHRAIADLLAEHPTGGILVNSDSPTLPDGLIADAAKRLREPGDKLVIGPARDGGYYLIGLNTAHWALFEGISWSTPVVLRETLQRAERIGLPVVRLRQWYDVDDAESLGWLRTELASSSPTAVTAAHTRAVMAELGLLAGPA